MPNRQKHRGSHPSDVLLFSEKYLPALKTAVTDLSWLLSRGYAANSSLKLICDRFFLKERQRKAVMRCSCSDQSLSSRQLKHIHPANLRQQDIAIDGFNLLITIESGLSGGLVFEGRDGCYRDIASVHGSYRKVEETEQALLHIGACLETLETGQVNWHLDKPVSNSGRLAKLILDLADQHSWPWSVSLDLNPDKVLAETSGVVVSSDGEVLDTTPQWYCLARHVIESRLPQAAIVHLADTPSFLQGLPIF